MKNNHELDNDNEALQLDDTKFWIWQIKGLVTAVVHIAA